MTRKERALLVYQELQKRYPHTETFLHFHKDWELLFAIILSAQATDVSVNQATENLFVRFPELNDYNKENEETILKLISHVGLGKSKCSYLIKTAQKLLQDYQGIVPQDREVLQQLPGVGYKTSGVFLGEYYNEPYIPVDTHVYRVSHRLALVKDSLTPEETEVALEKLYASYSTIHLHRQFILFGRELCTSKKERCIDCPFSSFCPHHNKKAV